MFDPWDDFRRFEEMMNRMYDEVWGKSRRPLLPSGERGEIITAGEIRQPFIDILDTKKELIATAELPGFEKPDININLTRTGLK